MSKKTTNILLIIGAIILVIGLIVAGFGIIRGGLHAAVDRFNYYQGKTEGIEPVTIADGEGVEIGEHIAEQIVDAEISIQVKAANISIVADTETWLETSGFKDGRIGFSVSGGRVAVTDSEFNSNWDSMDYDLSINGGIDEVVILHLNAESIKSLDISAGAADIACDGLNIANTLRIRCGASNLAVNGGKAGKLDFEIGAGNVIFESFSADIIEGHLGAAAMTYEGSVGKDVDIEVGTGSLEMSLAGSADDYYIEAEVGLGSIEVDGKDSGGIGEFSYGSRTAPNKMEFDCGLGVIEVSFK